MASPSGTANLCNLSTASQNVQSLPRIRAGSVHYYSMTCACILGNDWVQFGKYVGVYVSEHVYVCAHTCVSMWVGRCLHVCLCICPVHVFTSHWAQQVSNLSSTRIQCVLLLVFPAAPTPTLSPAQTTSQSCSPSRVVAGKLVNNVVCVCVRACVRVCVRVCVCMLWVCVCVLSVIHGYVYTSTCVGSLVCMCMCMNICVYFYTSGFFVM